MKIQMLHTQPAAFTMVISCCHSACGDAFVGSVYSHVLCSQVMTLEAIKLVLQWQRGRHLGLTTMGIYLSTVSNFMWSSNELGKIFGHSSFNLASHSMSIMLSDYFLAVCLVTMPFIFGKDSLLWLSWWFISCGTCLFKPEFLVSLAWLL